MNIVEIIKKAPEDHVYWSLIFGECEVEIIKDSIFPIYAHSADKIQRLYLTERGTNIPTMDECLLFPSKDNRDWAAFDRELDGFSTSISLELKGEEEQKFIKGLLSTFTACAEINLDHSYYDEHPLIDFRVNGKKYSVSVGKIRELVLRDGENLKEESNDKGTDR